MIKTKVVIEHKIGDRIYEFQCVPDSPLGEIYDAISYMNSFIINKMIEEQKKNETPEAPKEA
jgi:hypothetical protein